MKKTKKKKKKKDKKIKNVKTKKMTSVKDIVNPLRLTQENKAIKNRINRDIRARFEHEEDYYKPLKSN